MFDIAPTEMLLVAFVALVVIGPKDLPRVLRVVGQWVGRARGVARHFRSGIDEMIRQSELEEMEKRWASENARIMREHPAQPYATPTDRAVADDIAVERAEDMAYPPPPAPVPTPLPAPPAPEMTPLSHADEPAPPAAPPPGSGEPRP